MAYEIPQSLQYKERIVFNLTLQQLLYAVSFGFVAFLIYAKLPFSNYARGALALIPAGLGLTFMYFDLWEHLKNYWAWYKRQIITKYGADMKRYLKLNGIKESCYLVQTKHGEKRVAVIMVEPLNFKIKTKDERESIIYSFQKFLNALDFPIQFLMYTGNLNLNQYLNELEMKVKKTNNKTYYDLFEAHQNYLDNVMQERLRVNRRFLIAVQENQVGLDAQLNIVNELLRSMNLKSVRLDGRQLTGILRHLNNQDRELKPDTFYNRVAPEVIVNKSDHIKVNDKFNRIIAAVGYPRTVEEGFLDKIITAAGTFDLSIHVEPFPIDTTLMMLNKELQKQRADLFAAGLKHAFQPSLEIQYSDTRRVLESVQKGEEKLFNVSLYINVKANNEKELDILTKTIQSQLNSILIIPKVPKYRMAQGLKSVMPFGVNELGIRRNITTHALSAFFPFTSPFLILEKGGVFLGLNKNQLPIIKDIYSLANANGAILATSGSGKSYAAKLIISRYLMNGTKVIVIDPQSEYAKLTEKYGGSVINISKDSETIINPLDLLENEYDEKRLALLDLFNIMFGQLNESQRAILDKALTKTYEESGISSENYYNITPPILLDLFRILAASSKKAGIFEKGTYTMLLNRLSMFVDGSFSFLNRQTQINVNNNFVTFNIGRMPKQVKPVMMFLILDYVYSQMKKDRERKLLVIDEAWSMLQHAQEEGYIFEIVKTCRKWNLGLLLITQDVADLLNSNAGRAVLANSSYTVLLRQKPAVIRSMESVFDLSFAEREHLLTANVGEGILMMENDHQELKIIASPEEHNIITTKPEEMVETKNIPADVPLNARKFIQQLDLECDVYKTSVLQPAQDEYLRKNNYLQGKHIDPYERAYGRYHVKRRGNEGADHTFLAWRIYQELLNYTSKVRRNYSTKSDLNPDIVFTNEAGQEIAIEVETGSNHKYNYDYLIQKIKNLNNAYQNRWCTFLTNAQWKPRYETLCETPVLLRKHLRRFLKKQFPKGAQVHNNTTQICLTKNIDGKKERPEESAKSLSRPKSELSLQESPKTGLDGGDKK